MFNALSKWPDTLVCAAAASALAERVVDDPELRKDLTRKVWPTCSTH